MRLEIFTAVVALAFCPVIAAQDPPAPPAAPAASQPEPAPLNAIFEQFAAASDDAAVDRAFRERPYEVILLVDQYLEGWLAEQEKPEPERSPQAGDMLKRALHAAERGDQVFGVTAYSRYANAWQGWSLEQRAQFRDGQRLYGEGTRAWSDKRYEDAQKAIEQSLALADALGDAWGTAQAEQKLGNLAFGRDQLDDAEKRMKRSLQIFGELRHVGMLRALRGLAAVHEKQGKLKEARADLERMLAVAKEAHREESADQVRADLSRICRALGDEAAAKRYEG